MHLPTVGPNNEKFREDVGKNLSSSKKGELFHDRYLKGPVWDPQDRSE